MSEESTGDADLPGVLDAGQVARLLNLNIDYVRKLSREGVLPAHRLPGGRTFRYFKDEVLAWLREQPANNPERQDAAADEPERQDAAADEPERQDVAADEPERQDAAADERG